MSDFLLLQVSLRRISPKAKEAAGKPVMLESPDFAARPIEIMNSVIRKINESTQSTSPKEDSLN